MDQPPPPAPPPPKHLLALKVLRLARPTFAPTTHPYTEDNALTSSALHHASLRNPLTSNPTLHPTGNDLTPRDFGLSPVLTLPSAFGTIHLGQEFAGLLSVQNETGAQGDEKDAKRVEVKVEMQTAGAKVVLAEMGPRDVLKPGEGIEVAARYEIKELGMHALVCTVTYNEEVSQTDQLIATEPQYVSRSFRKLYKFQSTNPLSVKPKSSPPLSTPHKSTSNALLSPTLRQQTYLEVQVSNQSTTSMVFQSVGFDPSPGLTFTDLNLSPSPSSPSSFQLPAQLAHLSPGDTSQFLFLITPLSPNIPLPKPGTVQTLGRLDIVWRSPMGEIGRLQTSGLTRKIPQAPLAPAIAAAAATPPGSLRGSVRGWASPTGSATPNRRSVSAPPLASSGVTAAEWAADLVLDLTVTKLDHLGIKLEQPFEVEFTLRLLDSPRPLAKLYFAVQRVDHNSRGGQVVPVSGGPTGEKKGWGAMRESFVALRELGARGSLETLALGGRPGVRTSVAVSEAGGSAFVGDSSDAASDAGTIRPSPRASLLPPPRSLAPSLPYSAHTPSKTNFSSTSTALKPLGSSLQKLPPLTLTHEEEADTAVFKFEWLPVREGAAVVGGLRVLLVGVEEEGVGEGRRELGAVVKEWEVVGEVWVAT